MVITLGRLFRLERVRQGRGLRECARIAGISPSFLTLIEQGERSPSPEILGRLVVAISDDPIFRQKAVEAASDQKLGGKRWFQYLAVATHGIAHSSNQRLSASEAIVRSGSAFEQQFELPRDEFVAITRLILRDPVYREHLRRLAEIPEPQRHRILRALNELIPSRVVDPERMPAP